VADGLALLLGARFLQFAAAAALFGAACFTSTAAPGRDNRTVRSYAFCAALTLLFGTLAWLIGETAQLSEDPAHAIDVAQLWMIASGTRFGRICLLRMALELLCLLAFPCIARPRTLWRVLTAIRALVLMSFAWTGHGSMDGGLTGAAHLGADLAHLLTAGLWLGALPPLAMLVMRARRSKTAADALAAQQGLERFSSIGVAVVVVLASSGIVNSWFLVGPQHATLLLATPYGIALSVKLGLFCIMLVVATINRYQLSPALQLALGEERAPAAALDRLHASLWVEMGLAVLILAAVSVLGNLTPPMATE
jgi:putative copper resistance protein D